MLVLARKVGETIIIDGRIVVKVLKVDGDGVKLGIDAPADVPVHRQELYDEIQKSNRAALLGSSSPVPKLNEQKSSPSNKSAA